MSPAALFTVVGLFTAVAAAQPSTENIEAWLQKLDSPTLAEREAAELELFGRQAVTIEQIEALARRDDLSPEQEFRLRKAARGRFIRKPLAGMGVAFSAGSSEGVPIGETIPGFHAQEVLKPLDIITVCDGRRMRVQEDLQASILSANPGDVLELEVLRDGERLTLEVRLGSFDDLRNAQRPSAAVLARAFDLHWEQTVENLSRATTPIGAGISVEEWARVEAGEADENRGPLWPMARDSASRLIAFGGRPRSGLAIRQALADYTTPDTAAPFRGSEVFEVASIIDRMRSLSRQLIVLDQRAQTLETHADMVADPARREQLLNQRQAALTEAIDIERQLADLREALRVLRDNGR